MSEGRILAVSLEVEIQIWLLAWVVSRQTLHFYCLGYSTLEVSRESRMGLSLGKIRKV